MKYTFSIVRLDSEHIDEICRDIEYQYNSGIASMPLFSMTLVPEGKVPVNKAAIFCEKYKLFKERLDKMNVPSGVLVQASIGHGWLLGENFPYQHYLGTGDGVERNVVCPFDDGFQEYIYDALRTIALCAPHHIMIDDDLRLMHRLGGGCICPLHVARFNELCNTSFTQEEISKLLKSDDPKNEKYKKVYFETQREAVVKAATTMRKAIDSVNPRLQGSYSCVGNPPEFGGEIGKILAGEGNKVIVRINNAFYCQPGLKYFSWSFCRAASQKYRLEKYADVVLAETDTCPQNRYSTSAMSLHSHFTGSLLEGLMGAKHWITRAIYEPESGKAYRRVLSKYNGFYDALTEIYPCIEKWYGLRMPILETEYFTLHKDFSGGDDKYCAWGKQVFERFGLPMFFSAKPEGITCIDYEAARMTDSELLKALSGHAIISSVAAEEIIKRGFGKYIGVDVKAWEGKTPNAEKVIIDGKSSLVTAQKKLKQLIVTGENVLISSVIYSTVDNEHYEELFPGCTVFENELCGRVITFAGSPDVPYDIVNAFGFLNYTRKMQFISLLSKTGLMPVCCVGDEELYCKCASLKDGRLMLALFNFGFDDMESIETLLDFSPKKITHLTPNGKEEEVAFSQQNGKYILDLCCNTLEPVILFFE